MNYKNTLYILIILAITNFILYASENNEKKEEHNYPIIQRYNRKNYPSLPEKYFQITRAECPTYISHEITYKNGERINIIKSILTDGRTAFNGSKSVPHNEYYWINTIDHAREKFEAVEAIIEKLANKN